MKPEDQINFFNEDISFSFPYSKKLPPWIRDVARREGFAIDTINIIFCSDQYLHTLNTTYLHHNNYTDIITFDYGEEAIPKHLEGDIFISIDRIRENALELDKPFFQELCRVIIHGILHLTGIKDKTTEEKQIMRSKEDTYLSLQSFLLNS